MREIRKLGTPEGSSDPTKINKTVSPTKQTHTKKTFFLYRLNIPILENLLIWKTSWRKLWFTWFSFHINRLYISVSKVALEELFEVLVSDFLVRKNRMYIYCAYAYPLYICMWIYMYIYIYVMRTNYCCTL